MTNPHRVVIDLLNAPEEAQGIDHVISVFKQYMQSDDRDIYALMCAAKEINNGDIVRRLGFLTSTFFPGETALIEACKIDLSEGQGELYPKATSKVLNKDWQLFVSEEMMQVSEKLKVPKRTGSLKRGYTTGACATAASLAATRALVSGEAQNKVQITLPLGQEVVFVIHECVKKGEGWFASVRKDGGDDPDVTHLALICSTVTPRDKPGLQIIAGTGVGQVTKPGLGLEVGGPAINPVPRKMITSHIESVLERPAGLQAEISIPNGEELAKKTLNGRLGIVGGLSILGTTGIVKPFSTAAYRASIVQAIRVAIELGRRHLVLTTGGKSERFAQKIYPDLAEDAFIQMGDFVGAAVNSAVSNKAERITLCGMVGKISKVANKKDMTHAAGSSVNMTLLAGFAKDCGAGEDLQEAITQANTARHVGEIIEEAGLTGFYDRMAKAAADFVFEELASQKLSVDVIITDLITGDILGRFDRTK